jgi:hypothetical protein
MARYERSDNFPIDGSVVARILMGDISRENIHFSWDVAAILSVHT